MTRRWRIAFYSVIALFWVVALGAALEVYEAFHTRAVERAAEAYGRERLTGFLEDAKVIESTAAQAPAPPPGVKRDAPLREAFVSLGGDKARAAFAEHRRELIMVCGLDGEILSIYASPEPAEVAELAGLARVGGSVAELLPPVEGQDAIVAIGQAAQSGLDVPREYTVPLPSGARYVCEFVFYPLKNASGTISQVAVFVRDSIWEETWLKFRPHVYRKEPFEFWTNSHGFRDEEVTLPKPPGVYRIVCIGGSTTVEGSRNDLTYPNMLERKLREHFATDKIEVINCGIFASTLGAERGRLPDYLELEPDLIVHYNFVNDVEGVIRETNALSPFGRPLEALKPLLRRSRFAYRHFNWRLLPSKGVMRLRIRQDLLGNLEFICAQAKKSGVGLAVCSFARPDIDQLAQEEVGYFNTRINNMVWGRMLNITSYARLVDMYNVAVRELCEENDMLYIPVAENLKGGTDCFSDICHMFLNAMELKADIVFDSLKDYLAPRLTP